MEPLILARLHCVGLVAEKMAPCARYARAARAASIDLMCECYNTLAGDGAIWSNSKRAQGANHLRLSLPVLVAIKLVSDAMTLPASRFDVVSVAQSRQLEASMLALQDRRAVVA